MASNWKKIGVSVVALSLGIAGTMSVVASGKEDTQEKAEIATPAIAVQSMAAERYRVRLTGFGEVTPIETTRLSARVSGELVQWSENFIDGGFVRKGDILFTIDKVAYEAAVLQADANLIAAQARLVEEKARVEVAKKQALGLPIEKITDLYLRKPQLMSAQAAVKSSMSALKLAQRDLDNCTVVAPFDAVVAERQLGLGQMLLAGTPVATLHNIERAQVIFPVANFDRAFLPETVSGVNVNINYTADPSHNVSASLARDLGVVDNGTRMLNLVAEITDPYGIQKDKKPLYFGTYVTLGYDGKLLDSVFKLPQDVIKNSRVWVVENDKLYSKEVSVLRQEGEFYIVSAELVDGTQIAMSVPDYPQEGMSVQVISKFDTAAIKLGE